MEKIHYVGHISMDTESYNKFISLPKDKQEEYVFERTSPKNMELAKELLKDVPNGDNISKGNAKQTEQDNPTDGKGTGSGSSDARPKADTGKGK